MQAIVQDRYGGPEVLITREIERTSPLSEAAQALGHVGEGHAQGKVTVTMALRPGENSRPASASTAHSRAS
jgi:hypothetical protein